MPSGRRHKPSGTTGRAKGRTKHPTLMLLRTEEPKDSAPLTSKGALHQHRRVLHHEDRSPPADAYRPSLVHAVWKSHREGCMPRRLRSQLLHERHRPMLACPLTWRACGTRRAPVPAMPHESGVPLPATQARWHRRVRCPYGTPSTRRLRPMHPLLGCPPSYSTASTLAGVTQPR